MNSTDHSNTLNVRDYIAIKAMVGMIGFFGHSDSIPEKAYDMADKMIALSNKEKK